MDERIKPIAFHGGAVSRPHHGKVEDNKSFILHPLASQASGPSSYPIA